MSLFQRSVVKKYLAGLDGADEAWRRYRDYFLNETVQENLRSHTEEQLQGEFLLKLFGEILGYTLSPDPDYNLVRETKNVKDSKSADGTILRGSNVFAVIELKDTRTVDLDKVEAQAFGYKNAHRGVRYVITSNFERLRIYIDSTLDYEEFELFEMTEERFREFWLYLAKPAFLDAETIARLFKESRSNEESITSQLYADYSAFKRELFDDILAKNREAFDPLTLFKKTQKLLDRFVFIFFCEDRGLLPENTIAKTIEQWRGVQKWEKGVKLYGFFKRFFEFINTGNDELGVFAYNGGLFAPDDVLDSLEIESELLARGTQKLSNYDFVSDVDVNILGHIFEHSLTEIEEVTASLRAGEEKPVKTVSKRKRDGVFYTPSYITRFIVENTLGALCGEKRAQLGISEEEYAPLARKEKKEVRAQKQEKLDQYREWLLGLKICDPACGSGAFLVAALQFLIEEHKKIDLMSANIQSGANAIIFDDIDKSILEKNLYGVDINEESVEIARLSLWLHTCRKGRKLNDLSQNIKCGNSLVTELFDWDKEFPFGGFDAVIGNPPYVQFQAMEPELRELYASCGYEVFNKSADIYCLFTERGYNLLKPGGYLSFIMPNKWMLVDYGKPLRAFMAKTGLRQILNFGDVQFFADATIYCCIFVTSKRERTETVKAISLNNESYSGNFMTDMEKRFDCVSNRFEEAAWKIVPVEDDMILHRMEENGKALEEWCITINYGIKTGYNEAFYIDTPTKERLIKEDPRSADIIKPLLRGRDLQAYYGEWKGRWQITPHNGIKEKNIQPINIDDYPAIKRWLDQFYTSLKDRYDKGDTPYNLRNCVYIEEFNKQKIIYSDITSKFPFVMDDSGAVCNNTCYILTTNEQPEILLYLIAIFNSSFAKLVYWYNYPELQGGTRRFHTTYFEKFPVPEGTPEQTESLANKAKERIALTKQSQQTRRDFLNSLTDRYPKVKISTALEGFEKLEFSFFLKELKKQKITLKLGEEQTSWRNYFDAQKEALKELTARITLLDREIDAAVAELYRITPEEAARMTR